MASSKGKSKEKQIKSSPASEVDVVAERFIVPGKLSEKEWNELISIDEGVEIVCEIVEDVVAMASDIVLDHYLENKKFSYAVLEAKKEILQFIGMQFVARDEGEPNITTDPTWQADEEPVPAPIDPLACGVMPLASQASLHSLIDALEPIHVQPSEVAEERLHILETLVSTKTEETQASPTKKKVKSRNRPVARHHQSKSRQTVMVALDQPPEGSMVEGGDREQPCSPSRHQVLNEETSSPVRKMPPGYTPFGLKPSQLKWMKEVQYNEKGEIVDMIKLDPRKFPSHSVRPTATVVHPPKDYRHSLRRQQQQQQPRLKPLHQHQPPAHSVPSTTKTAATSFSCKHKPASMDFQPHAAATMERTVTVMPSAAGLTSETSERRFPEMPSVLPSLVDTIDPVSGVTVRDGGRSVQGPSPLYQLPISPPRSRLKPIRPIEGVGVGEGNRGVAPSDMVHHQAHSNTNVTEVAS